MLVIFGKYRLFKKILAYRNDYCLTCDKYGTSIYLRSLHVLHVFWVLVLPVGIWKVWHCEECGSHPHRRAQTKLGYRIIGCVLLALFVLINWVEPISDADAGAGWTVRIVSSLGWISSNL